MPPIITSHQPAHKTDSGKRATALAHAFQYEIDRLNAVAKVGMKRKLARSGGESSGR
jgi:hypothetical protein